jgi:predicted transcriptional regulator
MRADGAAPMKTPTLHFVEQACRVAELLDAGYSNRRIAEQLGVSAPRVSQIRQRLPALQPYLSPPEPTDWLRNRRDQLWSLRRQALSLAATIRRDLQELNEELEAAEIDRLLGLR